MSGKKIAIIATAVAAFLIGLLLVAYAIVKYYDYNRLKPEVRRAVLQMTGKELVIDGDITLGAEWKPVLWIEDVRLGNADEKSRLRMFSVKRIEIKIKPAPLLLGNIRVESMLFVEPDILLEMGENDPHNATAGDDGGKAPLQPKSPALIPERFLAKRGTLRFREKGEEHSYRFKVERLLAVNKPKMKKIHLKANGSYENHPYEINGTFGGFNSFFDPRIRWPVNFQVKMADAVLDVEGTLKKPMSLKRMELDVRLSGENPKPLCDLLGYRFPLKGDYQVSGSLSDPSARVYKIENLEVKAGENNATGQLQMDLSGKTPNILLKIAASKADLRPFFSRKNQFGKKSGTGSPRLFSHEKIPFQFLNRTNGEFFFSADKLKIPEWTFQQVQFEAKLSRGRLRIDQMEGRVADGDISAVADIQTRDEGASVKTEINASKLSLSAMKAESGDADRLRGDVDIDLSVSGAGDSMASIMATLDGKAEIQMKNGRIANRYVKELNTFVGGLSSGFFRLLNPFEKTTEETVVTCFVCRFDIHEGILESEAMVFNTPHMVVLGNGEVNLKTEDIDFTFKPSPKEGIGIEGVAQINLSLNELRQPFKLGGTLSDPALTLDPAGSALFIGKALGGAALFGPAGIAAVLLTGELAGKEDPCLSAIRKAEKSKNRKEGKNAPRSDQEDREKNEPVTVKDYFE